MGRERERGVGREGSRGETDVGGFVEKRGADGEDYERGGRWSGQGERGQRERGQGERGRLTLVGSSSSSRCGVSLAILASTTRLFCPSDRCPITCVCTGPEMPNRPRNLRPWNAWARG